MLGSMTMSSTDRRMGAQIGPGQSDTGTAGGGARSGAGTGADGRPAPRHGLFRRLLIGGTALAAIGAVIAGVGFLAFTTQIAGHEPARVKPADAIVVLTGAPSRIVDAVSLLNEGLGQRLLITGVNRAISYDEMRRALPDGERLLDCCIDLGHKALNTRGNALEAAEWTRERRFRSLVVVTSSWHMPRAMMELSRALPDVELVAYPVVTSRTEPERWWTDAGMLKLLVKEYLKYIMATVKIRPAQAVAGPQAAAAPGGQAAAPH